MRKILIGLIEMDLKKLEEILNIPNTGIVIIDMQEYFLKTGNKEKVDELIANQIEVIGLSKKLNLPIYDINYIHSEKNMGSTISELKSNLQNYNGYQPMGKYSDNMFSKDGEQILESIQIDDVKHLFFMGVNASLCVKDSLEGAFNNGFKVSSSSEVILDTHNLVVFSYSFLDFYKRKCLFFN